MKGWRKHRWRPEGGGSVTLAGHGDSLRWNLWICRRCGRRARVFTGWSGGGVEVRGRRAGRRPPQDSDCSEDLVREVTES